MRRLRERRREKEKLLIEESGGENKGDEVNKKKGEKREKARARG